MNPTPRNPSTADEVPSANDPAFSSLPEPLRLVAIETYRRLRAEGREPEEATRVALDQAREWEAARAPGAKPS